MRADKCTHVVTGTYFYLLPLSCYSVINPKIKTFFKFSEQEVVLIIGTFQLRLNTGWSIHLVEAVTDFIKMNKLKKINLLLRQKQVIVLKQFWKQDTWLTQGFVLPSKLRKKH